MGGVLSKELQEELARAANPRHLFGIWDVEADSGAVRLGHLEIASKDLCLFLGGSPRAALLAATLGVSADGMLNRLMHSNMAHAALADRLYSRMIEDYVSEAQAGITAAKKRYSPGYGDFCLSHQKDILAMLGCAKIGLYATDSFMLVPSKSITAVFPLGEGL